MTETKQLDSFALDWIKLRSLTLAKSINKTTMEETAQVVASARAELAAGFETGEPIKHITKRLEQYFEENEKWKAARLARTETIAASNEGALHKYETAGVGKSEFYPSPDACLKCLSKAGEYPTKEMHGMIPVHPNCRCQALPVV